MTELIYYSVLINVSGAGKTRVTLEGLCRHWGHYITCSPDPTLHQKFGGKALYKILQAFRSEPGINIQQNSYKNLQDWKSRANGVFRVHETDKIQCQFQNLLKAYDVVFLWFLHGVRIVSQRKGKQINDYKKHWLFLNLRPTILVSDIFELVYNNIEHEDRRFEIEGAQLRAAAILACGGLPRLQLFLVFDEIQTLLQVSPWGYLFENSPKDGEQKSLKPVLYPLIRVLMNMDNIRFVLTGTGFDKASFDESAASMAGKNHRLKAIMKKTVPFYFFDINTLESYLARYIPRDILDANGKILINRVFMWLRVR